MSIGSLTGKRLSIRMFARVNNPASKNGGISVHPHDWIFQACMRLGISTALSACYELQQISPVSTVPLKRPPLKIVRDDRVQRGHIILLPRFNERLF